MRISGEYTAQHDDGRGREDRETGRTARRILAN
jgi:hypothetical protein